jgi:hypothetical protein
MTPFRFMLKPFSASLTAIALACASLCAVAADQTVPGAGNALADQTAAASPRVREAHAFLVQQARNIKHKALREATLDLLQNRSFCVTSRVGVDAAAKAALIAALNTAGLIDLAAPFASGLTAGVFPPVLDAGTACPRMPMAFDTAPGSSFTSHHGYPGGLPIHEANNLRAALGLADGYRHNYRAVGAADAHEDHGDEDPNWMASPFFIDQDIVIAAPIWHDWAKTIVFQWTSEGQEFSELSFGGTPANGSATGGHHIISIAESIKRGLPAAFVIAQASAHSNPTLGNEFKVVNWIRAAAILAQVDPVAAGYLVQSGGGLRLPPLRKLADGFDLIAAGQTNLLAEYTLHNLSDGDFTFSIPAAGDASALIAALANRYGYTPSDTANYNTKYRNVVFAHISQERLLIVFGNGGLAAVRAELDALQARRII